MMGNEFGRYELLRPLAAGGMGEVYLARHDTSAPGFGSLVAIKVLLKNLTTNKAFVDMFLDEARTVARLRHDHIVQIRDIAHHDGQYYLVMEYIAGQNLRELLGDTTIEDRPLFSPRLGAQVFADLANALSVVHRQGLVHRDLSPNNIMISDEGVPKLIDFGVARALGSASLTTPGTLKGKFGYMAPEYIRSQTYDHRVDLFSLGVVMWETFTRRRLFSGTNAADQLHRVLEGEIARLDDVAPGFPTALADLVARTLERDPARRIPTATELADGLLDVVRAQPVDPYDPTLRKWLERRIPWQISERRDLEAKLRDLPPRTTRVEAPRPSDAQLASATPIPSTSGTSIRLASGEVLPSPPPPQPPARRGRTFVIPMVATAVVAVVLTVVALGAGEKASAPAAAARPAAVPPPPPPAAPPAAPRAPSASALHRQAGLDAMAAQDYPKAISSFAAAMRGGADPDLLKLLEVARRLNADRLGNRAGAQRIATPTTAAQTK